MFDATLVTAHSDKESAAANFKGGWGFHPLMASLDNTGEALAAVLRPGSTGSNTAADHIAVTDLALAQVPDAQRHGVPILVSADGAGATRAWLAHLHAHRQTGVDLEFSVGFTMTATVQAAILALPKQAWTQAINADGSLRDGADVAELTGMLGDLTAAGCPMSDILVAPMTSSRLQVCQRAEWDTRAVGLSSCHQESKATPGTRSASAREPSPG
jgi:hypothetical protein